MTLHQFDSIEVAGRIGLEPRFIEVRLQPTSEPINSDVHVRALPASSRDHLVSYTLCPTKPTGVSQTLRLTHISLHLPTPPYRLTYSSRININ